MSHLFTAADARRLAQDAPLADVVLEEIAAAAKSGDYELVTTKLRTPSSVQTIKERGFQVHAAACCDDYGAPHDALLICWEPKCTHWGPRE